MLMNTIKARKERNVAPYDSKKHLKKFGLDMDILTFFKGSCDIIPGLVYIFFFAYSYL